MEGFQKPGEETFLEGAGDSVRQLPTGRRKDWARAISILYYFA